MSLPPAGIGIGSLSGSARLVLWLWRHYTGINSIRHGEVCCGTKTARNGKLPRAPFARTPAGLLARAEEDEMAHQELKENFEEFLGKCGL